MAHDFTPYLDLIKIDPNVEMSVSDFLRFFSQDISTIDTYIKAANDRIEAVSEAGFTANLPVNVSDNLMKLWIENASSTFSGNLVSLLSSLPEHTPVRITGFELSLSTVNEVNAFYDVLDELYGLDESGRGLNKAQIHGTIDMGTREVSGDIIRGWNNRYPHIVVKSTKVTNKLIFFNHDGTEKLYEETLYAGNDSTWNSASSVVRNDHPEGYFYVFDGWSTTADSNHGDASLIRNVTETRILYAAYVKHTRTGPTFTVLQAATAMNEDEIVNIDYWEDYTTAVAVRFVKADETQYDQAILTSGNAIIGGNLLTIHMFSELYTGFHHSIIFSKSNNEKISVPILLIADRPSVHILQYVSVAGDVAVVKVTTLGRYARIVSLSYTESGDSTEYTVTSPCEIFNVNTQNMTFTIKMLSNVMINGKFALNVETSNNEPLRVPLPVLKAS